MRETAFSGAHDASAPGPLAADAARARGAAHGLHIVGITQAQPAATLAAYERWIADGLHGEMGYLARPDRAARRRDPGVILPGARSLLMAALHYDPSAVDAGLLQDPARGRISAYAWQRDYHDVLGERLKRLAADLETAAAHTGTRVYVDTGAILERAHAHEAGMGFIGKNTMLIHPRRGSYFFLGTLITTAAFDRYDAPPARASQCGTCTRCLAACPTGAFPTPYTLDARLCISYLTIEYKGIIDRALRPKLGNWVYGCDICQQVCPWNRFAPRASSTPAHLPDPGAPDPAFAPPSADHAAPPLEDLLALDEAGFAAAFAQSPIARIGRARLVRNAAVAAGNAASADDAARAQRLVGPLCALLHDPAPLVRIHAAWALGRWAAAGSAHARTALLAANDADPAVTEEIAHALTL
jgi:epoxyqueuosine reductase